MRNHQFDQQTLYGLSEKLYEDVEFLLDKLEVDYKIIGNRITGICPVHCGDNNTAFSLYNGTWTCYTHHCEKIFPKNMIGLVRGILSSQEGWREKGDKMVQFNKVLDWIFSFLKVDESTLKRYNKGDAKFISHTKVLTKTRQIQTSQITRDDVRSKLKFPAELFIKRGFKEQILNDYDIGLCTQPERDMSNRVVVPVYDDDHKFMIACLGRSIFPECPKCKMYHDPHWNICPTYNEQNFRKWTNSKGFNKSSYLFNFWKTKNYIKKSGKVLIVEGPLDVLRLEQENIEGSLALFGANMSDEQMIILERLPIQHMIILTDNDEAGNLARINIKEQCKYLCKIHTPIFKSHDIADCGKEEIVELKEFINKL